MDRISIIGTTGSGKSTLARAVSENLSLPNIELDAIHWQHPNWTPITGEIFRDLVADAVLQERWVAEGNYSMVRFLIWERADTVIWLDYSFPTVFGRLLRRTVRRILSREMLWGGCRETMLIQLSRESILLWCIKTHRRNRTKFARQLSQPDFRHLRVLHFETPHQTEAWLSSIAYEDFTKENQ